jgi:hypothetical protein
LRFVPRRATASSSRIAAARLEKTAEQLVSAVARGQYVKTGPGRAVAFVTAEFVTDPLNTVSVAVAAGQLVVLAVGCVHRLANRAHRVFVPRTSLGSRIAQLKRTR